MVGDIGCVCFDPRLPKCPEGFVALQPGVCQHYNLTFEQCKNYIAYHPSEYDTLQEWISRSCFGPPKLAE